MKVEAEVSPGHRYGCHNLVRGGKNSAILTSGVADLPSRIAGKVERIQIVETVVTEWMERKCGHDMRISDPSCTDCINREFD
jgi:hypothetical protein